MFDVYCPRHQSRVLLGSSSIEALTNTPQGILLHWHCCCGARGSLLTGRAAVEQAAALDTVESAA